MNYGNEEHYVYFADAEAANHAACFKASTFLGARPASRTTTTLHFQGMTHDNNADDVVTITHQNDMFVEVVETVCAALSRKGGSVMMTTVADDNLVTGNLDAGNNAPLTLNGTIEVGTTIAFDS